MHHFVKDFILADTNNAYGRTNTDHLADLELA